VFRRWLSVTCRIPGGAHHVVAPHRPDERGDGPPRGWCVRAGSAGLFLLGRSRARARDARYLGDKRVGKHHRQHHTRERHGRTLRPPQRCASGVPASGAPGYCSVLPNTLALAKTLKLNGYSTAQFGKCHEVPVWQTSPAGPFDAWPTRRRRLRVLLRLHRRRSPPVVPVAVRGHDADRSEEDARRGLSPSWKT
jgi:hypothetical protein